jgi:hypothetical protein
MYSLKMLRHLKLLLLQIWWVCWYRGTFGCRSKESESNGKCGNIPHGTGKDVKVLALVTLKEAEAIAAGADYVVLMNTTKN